MRRDSTVPPLVAMLWKRKPSPTTPGSCVWTRLYEESGASRYGMNRAEFDALLSEVEGKGRVQRRTAEERTAYFERLHLKDLVLARCCARGNEIAWNEFLSSYRPMVVNAARRLKRDFAEAEELADSLYADLFGLKVRDGERVSLLDSYQGTGSLSGWLRMVMAQREVEKWRRRRHLVAWEDEKLEPVDPHAAEHLTAGLEPVTALEQAVAAALARLPQEGRLLLTLYYLDERSLAEIGKFLNVHESTVSRRVNRLLQETRELVLGELEQQGLKAGAAMEALHTDVRRLSVDLRRFLAVSGRAPQAAALPTRLWRVARAAAPRPRQTVGDPT